MMNKNLYCVILAGGFGTRLWPLSRKGMPKQFLDFNNDGTTLISRIVRLMKDVIPSENLIVSTNLEYYEDVCQQLPELNPLQILREPVKKGTAPSLALAAYHIRELNPEARVVVVPSDIVILEEEPFIETLRKGLDFVGNHEGILTVGITPTRPETRFGYIQIDEDRMVDGMYGVRTFTEKPEESFAKLFVDSGEFYWNSGVLMWNVNSFIDIMRSCLPDISVQFDRIFDSIHNRDSRRSLLYAVYEALPHISVDYGLLEKTDKVFMVTGSFKWNDIESWDLLYDYCSKDENGNVLGMYNSQIYNCNNSMFLCNKENKLVVIDDLSDFVVVDTDDVLVICRRDKETDFKKYINDSLLKYGEKYT